MVIDWYRATLDFLKGNKVLLLIVTTLLSGNIYQATTKPSPTRSVNNYCEGVSSHIKEHH